MRTPHCVKSRSRSVWMKFFLQTMLSVLLPARYERGRPPRNHNCCSASEPNSANENPPMTIRSILPARLSRSLAHEIAGSAAENKKPCRCALPVGKNSQYGKKIRASLDFIDYDQSIQRSKGSHRFIQPGQTRWVFQVKIVDGIFFKQLARKRGFTALARPCQYDNAAAGKGLYVEYGVWMIAGSWRYDTMKSRHVKTDFHGNLHCRGIILIRICPPIFSVRYD